MLEGEEVSSTPVSEYPVPVQRDRRNIQQNMAQMRALFARGYGKRAVVIHIQDMDPRADMADPMHWGIITDVAPMDPYPLCVRWIDGRTSLSDGKDLQLVYSCATESQMIEWIENLNKPKQ